MAMKPVVIDLYHGNRVASLNQMKAFGIQGIIHKATQGDSYVDDKYAGRKEWAEESGLLWGAYHFATNEPVSAQVSKFLAVAHAGPRTLLALDWEPNGRRTMSATAAKTFLQAIYDKTGQRPVLYSGGYFLREQLPKGDAFFSQHRLWQAQYGPRCKVAPGWDSYWLWQYTGDGQGPLPHNCPGVITPNIDLNVFGGKDLAAEWV